MCAVKPLGGRQHAEPHGYEKSKREKQLTGGVFLDQKPFYLGLELDRVVAHYGVARGGDGHYPGVRDHLSHARDLLFGQRRALRAAHDQRWAGDLRQYRPEIARWSNLPVRLPENGVIFPSPLAVREPPQVV